MPAAVSPACARDTRRRWPRPAGRAAALAAAVLLLGGCAAAPEQAQVDAIDVTTVLDGVAQRLGREALATHEADDFRRVAAQAIAASSGGAGNPPATDAAAEQLDDSVTRARAAGAADTKILDTGLVAMARSVDADSGLLVGRDPSQEKRAGSVAAKAPQVESEWLGEESRRVLLLRVRALDASTAEQITTRLEALETAPAGVILDLRDNGGGLLRDAIAVADRFVSEGPIVTLRDRTASATLDFGGANVPHAFTGVPVVVLTNGGTAAGAELVAAALQDSGKGVVVGTTTRGAGLVRSVLPVTEDRAIVVTTAEMLRPAGPPIEGRGVVPDVLAPPCARVARGSDACVLEALQTLQPG